MSGGLLLSYYGDDFTGSTDVMEALSANGAPTVLFTREPSEAELRRFPDVRAIGLAGESRSRSPEWMNDHLPGAFAWLRNLGARYCHYKVCSTFDSSPETGSIGRATEIGMATFGQSAINMIVGAPQLRRYTMFGHLFAGYRDAAYRIDRHPVMSRHPSTPMHEADLARHLSAQCDLQVGCVDPDAARSTAPVEIIRRLRAEGGEVALIDVYDTGSQERAGLALEADREETGPFIVGSSGIEYALLSAWRAAGLVVPPDATPPLMRQDVIAVVSGSCSPTTERQIKTACDAGFEGVPVDYAALAGGYGAEAAFEQALGRASAAITAGRSPILYTALGPESVQSSGTADDSVGRWLGKALRRLLEEHSLHRVAVAGGDTSSHALSELGVYALTLRRSIPATPGSPACNAHRTDGGVFEIALKGGQVGGDDYFIWLRDGDK
ncbi:MAG: four-carbon acid sugar kinase family protein [Rhodobacteraceae bacterium]|nr:four-carbon acid sugar kinase family protein [Paracoccaceae bacterium]